MRDRDPQVPHAIVRRPDGGSILFDRNGKKLAEFPPLTLDDEQREEPVPAWYGWLALGCLGGSALCVIYLAGHVVVWLFR